MLKDNPAKKFPIIFAHRGANNFAPENSLQAFEEALKMGCDGVEMDLRYTASGEVIVFHDRNLWRMTGYRGIVPQMGLNEIRRHSLNQDGRFPIPTLQEVLDLLRDKLLINLELKRERFKSNGFETRTVQILDEFNLRDNIIISSFNPLVLKKIEGISNNKFHMGFIYRNRSHKMMTLGTSIKSLHIEYTILTKRYLLGKQKRGYKVYPWTVDKEESMRHLISMGVDGIITNRPEVYYSQILPELESQLLV
jgi:glycerophosphoryl diester phosphodiesterase